MQLLKIILLVSVPGFVLQLYPVELELVFLLLQLDHFILGLLKTTDGLLDLGREICTRVSRAGLELLPQSLYFRTVRVVGNLDGQVVFFN